MARLLRKLVIRGLLFGFLTLLLALGSAAFLAFDDRPLVVRSYAFTPEHVERAKALVKAHDPRKAPEDGRLRTMEVAGEDVDLVANYLASRLGGAAEIVLQDREALVRAAVPLPGSPIGGYLNVNAVLGETSGLPRFYSLTVGRLPVPRWLANGAVTYALRRLSESPEHVGAADAIKSVAIGEGLVRVDYEWRKDLAEQIKALAVPKEDAERLRVYHERIVRTLDDLPRRASLVDLIKPVMQLAAERSGGGDPAAENGAAIIAVALYVDGRGAALVPGSAEWPRAQLRKVLLRGRDDLPKHFTISAALAAAAGTPLSDAVGLYKEIDDSQGGTGFSFSDIAADRAGTAFGQMAVQSPDTARRLQSRISRGLTESDLMPEVSDLADHMQNEEFQRRFGGVGAPAYARVIQKIDRDIAGRRLFQ